MILNNGMLIFKIILNEKVILKRIAIKYVIIAEVLYRRSFDGALLRCLIQYKIAIALEQAHNGLCGGNFFAKSIIH